MSKVEVSQGSSHISSKCAAMQVGQAVACQVHCLNKLGLSSVRSPALYKWLGWHLQILLMPEGPEMEVNVKQQAR